MEFACKITIKWQTSSRYLSGKREDSIPIRTERFVDMKAINKLWILALLLAAPVMALASGAAIHLDKAPVDMKNTASLQRGAVLFASKCLACHSASYMRYNRLMDIGMNEKQIRKSLELPDDIKLGSSMQSMMDSNSAKLAFGVAPPDLSVIVVFWLSVTRS